MRILFAIQRQINLFGRFVQLWFFGVTFQIVLKSFPALIALATLFGLSFYADDYGNRWRKSLVEKQLTTALNRDDMDTAKLLLTRQISSGDQGRQTLYQYVKVLEAKQEMNDAELVMRKLLARRDAYAANWLLQKIYSGKTWPDLDTAQRKELAKIAEVLYQEDGSLTAKRFYVDYLLFSSQLPLALSVLDEISAVDPARALQGAAIARQMRNPQVAKRLAETALRQLETLAQSDTTNSATQIALASCRVFLEQFSSAAQGLTDARAALASSNLEPEEKTSRDTNLRQALADTLVSWAASIKQTSNASRQDNLQVLKLLESALALAPNNPRVLTMVADHVLQTIDSDDDSLIATRDALIAGTSPGIAHFIQGTSAMLKDDAVNAEMHLQLAANLLPRSGAILNNLAVALAARPDADLALALKTAESAISYTPQPVPHFFETRGQIFVKMERYLDAVPDLERALAVPELAPAAHQSLARCYKNLGQEELSREHEAAGKRLAASKN